MPWGNGLGMDKWQVDACALPNLLSLHWNWSGSFGGSYTQSGIVITSSISLHQASFLQRAALPCLQGARHWLGWWNYRRGHVRWKSLFHSSFLHHFHLSVLVWPSFQTEFISWFPLWCFKEIQKESWKHSFVFCLTPQKSSTDSTACLLHVSLSLLKRMGGGSHCAPQFCLTSWTTWGQGRQSWHRCAGSVSRALALHLHTYG